MVISANIFDELKNNEMIDINGGGLAACFFSMLGIAFSPAVIIANPVAGSGLLVTSIYVFGNNIHG